MATGCSHSIKTEHRIPPFHRVLQQPAKVDPQRFRAHLGGTQKSSFSFLFCFFPFMLGGGSQRYKEDWLMSRNETFQVLVMTPYTHTAPFDFSLNLRFKMVLGVNILIRLSSSSLLAILLSSHPSQTQTGWGEGKISLY